VNVDALMVLHNALEAQLKEQVGIQIKFTDAVVNSIGTGQSDENIHYRCDSETGGPSKYRFSDAEYSQN
jgi:hypothetical protein